MKSKFTLLLAFVFLITTALHAQDCVLKIGSVANSRGAANYTFDGTMMTRNLQKFANTSNFGAGGTVPYTIQVNNVTAPITEALLSQYDVFFIGYFPDGTFTAIELQAMFNWVNNGGRMVITADDANHDAVAQKFGYPSTSPTTNSNIVEPGQNAHSIFNGPFGTVTQFNGAGTLGYFPTSAGATILARSTQGFVTLMEKNVGAGKIVLSGDICQMDNATMTLGPAITNSNDRFFANLFHYIGEESCCQPPTITCQGNISRNNDPGQCYATVPLQNTNILQYNPIGFRPNNLPIEPTNVAPSVTASGLSQVGIPFTTANTNVWPVGNNFNTASPNPGHYLTFTTTFSNATELTNLTYHKLSYFGNGPTKAVIRTSLDGFSADVAIVNVNPAGFQLLDFNLSSLPLLSGTVTFRIYFYGAASAGDWADLASTAVGATGLRLFADQIAQASSNCGITSVTYSGKSANNQYPVGTTTITATATDAGGNTVSCSFDIVVSDNQPPVITCPVPNPSYNTDPGECNATLTFTATATDNCGVSSYAYSINGTPITFPYDFAVGTTTVTAVATDVNGNSSAPCTFDVKVVDNQAPVITCPVPNPSYNNDPGECNATLTFAATATDNCGVSSYAYSINGTPITFPYDFAVGTTTVTAVATDVNGNSSAPCTFDVKVVDNQAPVITCPVPNPSYNTDPGECNATLTFTATATDNCGVSSYAYSINGTPITFPYDFAVGTTTVTAVATDVNGNSSAPCTFDVKVVDNQAPVITCPVPNPSYNNDPGECNATLTFAATATDNCGVSSYAYSINGTPITFPYDFAVGTTTVTAVATDVNGNSSAPCTFDVKVVDNQAPVITCPVPNPSYNTDPGECNATLTFAATATDNCGVSSYAYSINGTPITFPYDFAVGTTTVTAVATDVNGNSVSCMFDVVVKDNEKPTIVCPANIVVNPTSLNGAVVTYSITSGDNCPGSTTVLVSGKASGSTFAIGTTTNTYTITDAAGNVAMCSFTVTVRDPYCDKNPKNKKVYVCHNGQTICISVNALQTHMGHNDQLGECAWYTTPPPPAANQDVVDVQAITNAKGLSLKAFPNPTNTYFTLNMKSITAENIQIKVYDVVGREVFTASGSANKTYTFGDKFSKGNYLVRVLQAGKQATIQVTKQ